MSSRSDISSNSQLSATSNHTIAFTVNNTVYGSSISGSSTLKLTFPGGFSIPGALDCGDVDAATSSQFNFNWPACQQTVTAWGVSVTNAISFVQTNAGQCSSSSLCTATSIPFTSNNTAGNLIVIEVDWNNQGVSVLSVTDTVGNVYTSALGPVNWSAGGSRSQIFYAKNIKAGANTVNVEFSSTNQTEVYVNEYSGADLTSPLDVTASSTGNSINLNSGPATTNFANELIFGAGITGGVISAAGAGFSARNTFNENMMEDMNVTTIGSYNATAIGDGSQWVMMMATFKTAPSITLVPPTDTATHVVTGTLITIKIGSNATVGQQGGHWITNPAAGGVYTISVGGTFGGSGNMLVSINAGVSVQATVAESLSLSVSSIGALSCTADDGATITAIGTAPTSVPFGIISANSFYQGCQDLVVSTNAGNGYSVTVQESSAMKTVDGRFSIPDTMCDNADCSVATATAWVTPTKNGFGHTCKNQAGSDCNPTYGNGKKFKPLSNIAAGNNGATISFVQQNATDAGAVSTNSTAFPNGNTAGNLIVAVVGWSNLNNATASISDTLGNTYASALDPVDFNTDGRQQIFYAKNIKGGANTVTATLSAATTFFQLFILEYSGVDAASPLDATSVATGSATFMDSGSKTTHFANELIFGAGNIGGAASGPGAGFVSRSNFEGAMMEDEFVATAGSYKATATGDGTNWIMMMAAFKATQGVGETVMSNTGSVTNSTGRVKYRLSAGAAQPAGTYTTLISYIITGTY